MLTIKVLQRGAIGTIGQEQTDANLRGYLINKPVTPMDAELFSRVDEVVHYVWDPIGVAQEPWARDEYNSYLSQIF